MTKIEVQQSQDYTFSWSFYDKNIQLVPTEGTIKVYKPGGGTLVDTTAVTIGTDGIIRYTLDSANTGTVNYNYRIELTYNIAANIYRPFYLFDIVKTPIINTVRDEDLFQYVEELRDKNTPYTLKASSDGTVTTLISDELIPLNIDFKGGDIEIYITDTDTHRAEISAWDKTTGTVTFAPAADTATSVDSGTRFAIRASYARFIDKSFTDHVMRDVRNRIGLAARFIDSTVVNNLTIYKALEMICFSKVEEEGDKWDIRSKKFKEEYSAEYVKIQEPVDIDDDGFIDDNENTKRVSFINKGIIR
nr:hypothetical protein 15 [Legionellales bacterium]